MRQAVILAGGKGTRLATILRGRPKPLVEIGGRPLLEIQLELLRRFQFGKVLLLVNYRAQEIEEFCRSKNNFGLDIDFLDDGVPRGTAGALHHAMDRLADRFLVLYGDTLLEVDLERFWAHHEGRTGARMTLLVHPNDHPEDSDLVEIDEFGWVKKVHPYPHPPGACWPNLVNAALYVMEREALEAVHFEGDPVDVAKHLLPSLILEGAKIGGYRSPEFIKDAGTPARLLKVERALASGLVGRMSLVAPQPAVFLDRDGTLIEDLGHATGEPDLHLFEGVGAGIERLNEAGYRTVVVTNQPGIAKGILKISEVEKVHSRMEWLLAREGAYVDRIYFCPHHPERGFEGEIPELKVKCDCRKPGAGLLLKAQQDLNIDLRASWFIGDSTADLGAAKVAGAASIIVETGKRGLDGLFDFDPDFSARDFSDAVQLMLDIYPRIREIARPAMEMASGASIFLGGASRSGKSTLAGVIARESRLGGRRAHIFSLDRWLQDGDERGSGVVERFRVDEILEALCGVLGKQDGGVIEIPAYDRLRRRRGTGRRVVEVFFDDLLIVEGVIAIEVARRMKRLGQTINLRTAESGRKTRIRREYLRRGADSDEIRQVLEVRDTEELEFLDRVGALASIQLSLDPAYQPMEVPERKS